MVRHRDPAIGEVDLFQPFFSLGDSQTETSASSSATSQASPSCHTSAWLSPALEGDDSSATSDEDSDTEGVISSLGPTLTLDRNVSSNALPFVISSYLRWITRTVFEPLKIARQARDKVIRRFTQSDESRCGTTLVAIIMELLIKNPALGFAHFPAMKMLERRVYHRLFLVKSTQEPLPDSHAADVLAVLHDVHEDLGLQWMNGIPDRFLVMLAHMHMLREDFAPNVDPRIIKELETDIGIFRPVLDESPDSYLKVARLMVQESWRQVMYIYLYMGLCGATSDDTRVQKALKKFIRLLDGIKPGRNPDIFLIFPMTAAGVAACKSRDRDIIRRRILGIQECNQVGTSGNDAVRTLDGLWAAVDVQVRPAVWSDLRIASSQSHLHDVWSATSFQNRMFDLHKKCDEIRPVCQRCNRAGIECLGYDYLDNPIPKPRKQKKRVFTGYSFGVADSSPQSGSHSTTLASEATASSSTQAPFGQNTSHSEEMWLPLPEGTDQPLEFNLASAYENTVDIPIPLESSSSSQPSSQHLLHRTGPLNLDFNMLHLDSNTTPNTNSDRSLGASSSQALVLNRFAPTLGGTGTSNNSPSGMTSGQTSLLHALFSLGDSQSGIISPSTSLRTHSGLERSTQSSIIAEDDDSSSDSSEEPDVEGVMARINHKIALVKASQSPSTVRAYEALDALYEMEEMICIQSFSTTLSHTIKLHRSAALVYRYACPEPPGTPIHLPAKLLQPESTFRHFPAMDILLSLSTCQPMLFRYDVTPVSDPFELDDKSPGLQWMHGIPDQFLVMLARMNMLREDFAPDVDPGIISELEDQISNFQPALDRSVDSYLAIARLTVQESWRQAMYIYLYMGLSEY
ncbi:hypothetical protein FRC07_012286 [Ceratobasidium sp. 392]|nr:hypothetical protein FRC07_012286 [Ceratobasidium sp. 392]